MLRICRAKSHRYSLMMANSGKRMKYYSSGPKSALPGMCMAETIVGVGSFFFCNLFKACAKSPGRIIYRLQRAKIIALSGKIQVWFSCRRRVAVLVGLCPDKNASLFNSKGAGPEVKSLRGLVQHPSRLSDWQGCTARIVLGWIQLSNWADVAELPCTEARSMLVS